MVMFMGQRESHYSEYLFRSLYIVNLYYVNANLLSYFYMFGCQVCSGITIFLGNSVSLSF